MASDFRGFTLTEGDESVDFTVLTVTPPDRTAGPGQARMTVEYQILHEDWIVAKRMLLGWPEVINPDDDKPAISRHTPHSWDETDPDIGVADTLYCAAVSRSRGQVPNEMSDDPGVQDEPYGLLNITAVYEALTYRILTDTELLLAYGGLANSVIGRYVEFGKSHGSATLGRSGRNTAFVYARVPTGSGDTPNAASGEVWNEDHSLIVNQRRSVLTWGQIFEVRYVEQTLIWMYVPQRIAPLLRIARGLNKINDQPFYIWDTGTVMLTEYDAERVRAANGEWCWHIPLKFKVQPNGWNSLPDPNNRGDYFPIVYKDAPFVGPYKSFDFPSLFEPAQENGPDQGGVF